MRQHLKPFGNRLLRLGIDLRSPREKAEQAQAAATRRAYALLYQYNREQLYEEVWTAPIRTVAKKYAISDVRLGKICRTLNIPKPGLGYWAKKAAGKHVGKRPVLPPLFPTAVRS